MNSLLRLRALTLASGLAISCHLPLVQAETVTVEVKSGDTLSVIIAKQYPGYKNKPAIMQAILERNPESFTGKNINRLIVGKSLELPDPSTIPALEPPAPPTPADSGANAARAQQAEKERDELRSRLQTLETDKKQFETRLTQERDALNARLQTLEADKKQLETKITELSSATAAASTPAPAAAPAGEEQPDPTILMQQLDEIESANEQLLTDKTKIEKERDELNTRLQTLEADKKQLETKITELSSAAASTPAPSAPAGEEQPDPAILMQQLDEIESANEQLLADKTKIEKERDELNTRLQTLEADKKQLETKITELSSAASTPATAAPAGEEQPDPAILMQQLDEIESANEQIRTEKETLQKELETVQKQLQERSAENSTLTGQVTGLTTQEAELKGQLETAQKDLQLAHAAYANAELTKANIEKNNHAPVWPWLLALLLLPTAWWLGRKSQTPATVKPTVPTAPAATAATLPVVSAEQGKSQGLPTLQTDLDIEAEADTVLATTYPTTAANDDDLDVAIKLDIVRAYLDLRDPESAQPILKEVLREGGRQQRQEAREILSFIS